MDTSAFLRAAADGFGQRVAAIGDEQWHAPTPCSEWDVRALLQHVVSECRWVRPLIEGRTIAEVGDSLDGDLLGDDPGRAWREASAEALAAAAEPGAGSRTVHLSFGDRRGDEYLRQIACDLTIHTWDLARGVGADDGLDPALVAACRSELETMEPGIEQWRAAGVLGPPVAVPDGAGEQDRLLGLIGRDPSS